MRELSFIHLDIDFHLIEAAQLDHFLPVLIFMQYARSLISSLVFFS